MLRDTANLTEQDLREEQRRAIDQRVATIAQTLITADVARQRRLSAELNGLYGLYGGSLAPGRQDLHVLLATDTYQARATAKLLESTLRAAGIVSVQQVIPRGLSTRSQAAFSSGIREMIRWWEETLAPCREARVPVLFNLVGSFKSLQGYLNTIGMFYADELLYIFEDPGASLLRIPRLPVQLDLTFFREHRTLCAMLAEQHTVPTATLAGWPEALWEETSPGSGHAWLSSWGLLVWERGREELLGESLLEELPRLDYSTQFRQDFDEARGHRRERIELNETLARVAVMLDQSQGNTAALKADGTLQYDNYSGPHAGIGHFRINNRGWRVSCTSDRGRLLLRRIGSHAINDHP